MPHRTLDSFKEVLIIKQENINHGEDYMPKLKVAIDRENCIGCGSCEALCPEVFRLLDDCKSSIVEAYRNGSPAQGSVDASLAECVNTAKDSCPVQVISVGA